MMPFSGYLFFQLLFALVVPYYSLSTDNSLMKDACYQSFFSSSASLTPSIITDEDVLTHFPLACSTISHPSSLQVPHYPAHLRLTPMQAQPEITAYKPQKFILNNLLKHSLSSMSPNTIKDHWQLYEGLSLYKVVFLFFNICLASVASFNALRRFLADHQVRILFGIYSLMLSFSSFLRQEISEEPNK